MDSALHIGLIGDLNPEVTAHRAIPEALRLAGQALGREVRWTWVETEPLGGAADAVTRLRCFHGLWCVPASPYRNTEGALEAIRFAREHRVPFLGTCGGFQHAILEDARNVLGWSDASHAERAPEGGRWVVTPLRCALVEVKATVKLVPGSRLAAAYGQLQVEEGYRCRYGLAPEAKEAIVAAGMRVAAVDEEGEVRALELPAHPFFVTMLFQPERAALEQRIPPPASKFVEAAAELARRRAEAV